MRAKKHLGQHFLKSTKIVHDMVQASALETGATVLEIGPGKGVLTSVLLVERAKVIAVEKDSELITYLQEKFSGEISNNQLELIERDILSCSADALGLKNHAYALIANIPYYITGAILRHFLSSSVQPNTMTLLIQKEVADRIVARDGKESILSLSVKAYGTPKYIEKVPARLFTPAPKVDSAVISIKNISKDFFDTVSEEDFFKLIKAGFAHKRKTLLKNLAHAGYDTEKLRGIFATLTIPENIRAEDVPLETWKRFAQ